MIFRGKGFSGCLNNLLWSFLLAREYLTLVTLIVRFMQALGGTTRGGSFNIQQESCLHGSLNLYTILYKGNGMAHKWNTSHALLSNGVHDFGACTVTQLLLGYDANLQSQNANGYYEDDGRNPCFEYDDYFEYITSIYDGTWTPEYDFVVLNDRSNWPAIEEKREETMEVLNDTFIPMLLENGAAPVLYATHGYESEMVDTSEFSNISEFTSLIFEGYRQYAALLEANLPSTQRPRIAPIGLAFLIVYEENYAMWQKLFFVDDLHPSPHGTYLMGCVLYATLYGFMPGNTALPSNPESLWSRARKMQIGGEYHMPFPTYDDCVYLYSVAKRLMEYGERPETFIQYYDDETESDYIGAN